MIVECPGCSSRYDVSGRPPGTRARCRCGTVFELPEPPNQAAMLECPRCGGSASANNHACEFCGIDLLVMACPRCFARMFHGSKHCTQCGTRVVAPACADSDGSAEQRACPRCTETFLVARLIGDVLLDDCPKCLGTFVDINALERIISERQQTRAQVILSALASSGTGGLETDATTSGAFAAVLVGETAALYVKCPDCHTLMNRHNFGRISGVIVDVCRHHGTWFDRDELARVIEFAASGGMERFRERERLHELENERQKRVADRVAERPGQKAANWTPRLKMPNTSFFGELLNALGGYLAK